MRSDEDISCLGEETARATLELVRAGAGDAASVQFAIGIMVMAMAWIETKNGAEYAASIADRIADSAMRRMTGASKEPRMARPAKGKIV